MRGGTKSKTLPSPTGGWDTREALSDMPVDRAPVLDNWFPDTDRVISRRGSSAHATGLPGSVESLIEFTPLNGSGKLFAASGGGIYDVTSAGAVGAAVVSGKANDRWQSVQIGTAGGQFLLAMNGQDSPITYDGNSWANASITGPTVNDLIWCNLHQRRLWFGQKNSLSGWYLSPNSISGTATEFSFAGVARMGGYVMAMETWTRDGGSGPDDVAVFLTSEGEAIVYAGVDPSSASTWSLIGVFRIGRPIGRRCMIKAGADLIMITQDGFVSASSILSFDRSQSERVALSAQINKAVNDAVRHYGGLFGWQAMLYPRGKMLVFNVPQSATVVHQYVFNTITGAPCRFTGINALCWGLRGENAFFGASNGTVYQFDNGESDDGTHINCDALQAFNSFGSGGQSKSFKRLEIIFQGSSDPSPAVDLNIDYQIKAPTGVFSPVATTAGKWGIFKWGIGLWGSSTQVFRGWRSIRGYGRAASVRVRTKGSAGQITWLATSFIYVVGGQR